MFSNPLPLRIAIYGSEIETAGRGVGLWSIGYKGAVIAAGATPEFLKRSGGKQTWGEVLNGCKGVVLCGFPQSADDQGDLEALSVWCKQRKFPILAIDRGLLAMNAALGGANYSDLSRELPEALQHRHPPEPGLRHAINVQPDTQLSQIYGEGEIVVNSEHRQAIQRVAPGFRIGGTALDGVIEAIESTSETWFAMGVQWQPASASASGLDIQVFRGLVDAANPAAAPKKIPVKPRRLAMAG
jgi:gamma-glutamyl-gamma-aminobutyrate hydrolase PuuD